MKMYLDGKRDQLEWETICFFSFPFKMGGALSLQFDFALQQVFWKIWESYMTTMNLNGT